ncbi:hypothetical protein ACFYNO_17235 [Kitasatospora sp. NPDC006697]|uniref:hypothetical protein n=1 Tax=Kitasatospora sp. NPDC006697 TaxID=3364020 RepID=UPI003698B49B
MTVLKRALGTTLAAGALLLTVGALPAGAQTAVTGQASFVGVAFASTPFVADLGAYNSAFAKAKAAGYTTAQCTLAHPVVATPLGTLWHASALVTCNA